MIRRELWGVLRRRKKTYFDRIVLMDVVVAWEAELMAGETSALDSGKGITSIETRNAAPLIAATASWATGLTGSMGVVSLLLKSTPSDRSRPRVPLQCRCNRAAIDPAGQDSSADRPLGG